MADYIRTGQTSYGTYVYIYLCEDCGAEIPRYHKNIRTKLCPTCQKNRDRQKTIERQERRNAQVYQGAIEDCIEAIADKYSIYDDTVFGIIKLLRTLEGK